MKKNFTDDYNMFFKFASRVLKYFLLALVGLAIAFVVSTILGAVPVINILQDYRLWQWMFRILAFIVCLFAIAMIVDSCQ